MKTLISFVVALGVASGAHAQMFDVPEVTPMDASAAYLTPPPSPIYPIPTVEHDPLREVPDVDFGEPVHCYHYEHFSSCR